MAQPLGLADHYRTMQVRNQIAHQRPQHMALQNTSATSTHPACAPRQSRNTFRAEAKRLPASLDRPVRVSASERADFEQSLCESAVALALLGRPGFPRPAPCPAPRRPATSDCLEQGFVMGGRHQDVNFERRARYFMPADQRHRARKPSFKPRFRLNRTQQTRPEW